MAGTMPTRKPHSREMAGENIPSYTRPTGKYWRNKAPYIQFLDNEAKAAKKSLAEIEKLQGEIRHQQAKEVPNQDLIKINLQTIEGLKADVQECKDNWNFIFNRLRPNTHAKIMACAMKFPA